MSTIPDPRHRAPNGSSPLHSNLPSPSHHPGLSDEVATLSTKLINAINHQTTLDDTLSETRHELESARSRIRDLEAKNATQREMMAGDVWVRRLTLDAERKTQQTERRHLQAQIAEEREKRKEIEQEKNKIEQELESLTAALFEEANQMVVKAKEDSRHEQDTLHRKNDQVRAQLADTEGLLKFQQDQLSELKHVMEMIVSERDDATNNTAPSSPGFAKSEARDDEKSVANDSVASPSTQSFVAAPPTSFIHLLQPVMRTDLPAYEDFHALAGLSRKRTGSRVSSGSIPGLGGLSLGLGGGTHMSSASTGSLTMTNGPSNISNPQSPKTPQSAMSPGSAAAPTVNLRDTRFYKRVLAEDIEPTLRLDIAPGISWLNRRSIVAAISDGTLVVEPVQMHSTLTAIARPQYFPCSLCGETRKEAPYLRNHRFRTTDSESSQRFPLCKYCLVRVRSTCDFVGFLRMVKDGHYRADSEDQEKAAWEESVRLRDQMFWARLGGGVVPAHHPLSPIDGAASSRPSTDVADDESGSALVSAKPSASIDKPLPDPDKPLPTPGNQDEDEAPQTPPEQTGNINESADATPTPPTTSKVSAIAARLSLNIP